MWQVNPKNYSFLFFTFASNYKVGICRCGDIDVLIMSDEKQFSVLHHAADRIRDVLGRGYEKQQRNAE